MRRREEREASFFLSISLVKSFERVLVPFDSIFEAFFDRLSDIRGSEILRERGMGESSSRFVLCIFKCIIADA